VPGLWSPDPFWDPSTVHTRVAGPLSQNCKNIFTCICGQCLSLLWSKNAVFWGDFMVVSVIDSIWGFLPCSSGLNQCFRENIASFSYSKALFFKSFPSSVTIGLNCSTGSILPLQVSPPHVPIYVYGPEHDSRTHLLCSHLMVSQLFMAPEGSLPHSQELSTCPYPEPDQTSPHHPILSSF
jgi:hypothetical protein